MGLGMKSIIQDLGFKVRVRIHSDACAAIGMAQRRGLGRVRHLDVEDLWVQTKVHEGHVDLLKVAGSESPADILTKYASADLMDKMLLKLNLKFIEGRSPAAPDLPPSCRSTVSEGRHSLSSTLVNTHGETTARHQWSLYPHNLSSPLINTRGNTNERHQWGIKVGERRKRGGA